MSRIRKFFSFRRTPKLNINPKDDFRQLDYVMHDVKVFQSISERQKQALYPIRDVVFDKVSNATSVAAKLKVMDDALADSIEVMLLKSSTSKLSEIDQSTTADSKQLNAPKTGGGLWTSLFSSKSSEVPSPSAGQIQQLFLKSPRGSPLLPYTNMQLILRLQLCKEYFISIQSLLERSEISTDLLKNNSKLFQLIDAVLLGNSSERVSHHMSLFGPKIFQYTLQSCFYSLYEAELQAMVKHLDKYPMQLAAHDKLLRKNTASTYLLDSLELNTKSRCVLAWMDPEFSGGFRPLADDHNLPINQVIKGRRLYFPEGEKIALLYAEHLKSKFTEYQNTKEEDRDTLRQGTYFVIVTILLDWLICTI